MDKELLKDFVMGIKMGKANKQIKILRVRLIPSVAKGIKRQTEKKLLKLELVWQV